MNASRFVKSRVVVYLKKRSFYQDVVRLNQELTSSNQQLQELVDKHRPQMEYFWFAEPGHFYSPLLDTKSATFNGLFDLGSSAVNLREVAVPGVALHKQTQQALLREIAQSAHELPDYEDGAGLRYRYENDQFGRMDASVLFLMLRHLKPKHVIEVGSGWSSALMLDVNERFPRTAASLTFIEPHPERLYSTMRRGDKRRCKILVRQVQSIPLAQFQVLQKDDILFIDNSHVSKYHSDVNYLLLKVLPSLRKGVVIHIHDIFYPFEYPIQWVKDQNRNWNEIYLLHALLIGSNLFEIMFWPSYLKVLDQKKFEKLIPTAIGPGGSIWLRKVR